VESPRKYFLSLGKIIRSRGQNRKFSTRGITLPLPFIQAKFRPGEKPENRWKALKGTDDQVHAKKNQEKDKPAGVVHVQESEDL
jgi:hypothetical protein